MSFKISIISRNCASADSNCASADPSADPINTFTSMGRMVIEMEDADLLRAIENISMLQQQFAIDSKEIDVDTMPKDMQIKVFRALCKHVKDINAMLLAIGTIPQEQESIFVTQVRSIYLPWRNDTLRFLRQLLEQVPDLGVAVKGCAVLGELQRNN